MKKLSLCETILDESKFLESHKQRILNGSGRKRNIYPFISRLERYALDNEKMLCNKCYEVYGKEEKGNHKCR
jgi:hypothetical protein